VTPWWLPIRAALRRRDSARGAAIRTPAVSTVPSSATTTRRAGLVATGFSQAFGGLSRPADFFPAAGARRLA